MSADFTLQPIRTEPAYRVAAQALRKKIVDGEIEVGAVLPSETAMAELLEVNRSTIREAIRLLEENGIVARKPGGKKLYVTVPKSADLSNRVSTAMLLKQITLEELWGTMMVLEPATAEGAVEHADADDLAALEENLRRTRDNLDDSDALLGLDLEFHTLVSLACGNRAIQLARAPVGELFYPAVGAMLRRLNAGERMLVAHTKIVQAIKDRDAVTAGEWMRKHIVDFRRGCELVGLDMDSPARGPSKR